MMRLGSLATAPQMVSARRVLLACCTVFLLALIVPLRAGAVVGGKTIRAGRYPGVVQVVANDFAGGQGTLCGGALIAPRLVVTAGHCFLHVPFHSLRPVSVVFGRQWSYPHKNPPAGIHIGVVRVAHAPINPKLRQSFPDDVEVLYLRRPAPVKPLKLGAPAAAKAGAPVFALGWGLTSSHESELRRNQLHGLAMHVRSSADCRRLAGSEYDAATQICLSPRPGGGLQGTCYGDSGSPLLSASGSTVLGTVSTSNNFCGKGASIFTRLTSGPLRHWVNRQINASRRSAAAPPQLGAANGTTYGYTGQVQTVTVPPGAAAVQITAAGGGGGDGSAMNIGPDPAGKGAQISGYIPVTPGQQLTLTVGGQGGNANETGKNAGGWGGSAGGGNGAGSGSTSTQGGGGGGATTVTLGGQTLLVAGGGGGAGGGSPIFETGGRGGSAGSTAGNGSTGDGTYGAGRGGAGGGAASPTGTTGGTEHHASGNGGGGGGGVQGGNGGGGGGLGGGGGGGGGSGSSTASSSLIATQTTTASTAAPGSVTLTWLSTTTTTCNDLTENATAGVKSPVALSCSDSVPIVSYALVSTPTYGLVTTPTTSGTLTYTPLSSFSGTDGFKYTATNVLGQTSAPATVTLNVTSPSPTPTSARTVQSKHIQR